VSLISFNLSLTSAEYLKCEVQETIYSIKLFLNRYDDNDEDNGYVWFKWIDKDNIELEDMHFLPNINDVVIPDDSPVYNTLLSSSNRLREIGYNPLSIYQSEESITLNNKIMEILKNLVQQEASTEQQDMSTDDAL